MLVAIALMPPGPSAPTQAAAIAGLAPADASRLLAGTLPRVLVRGATDGNPLAGALEAVGFKAFTVEESQVATAKDRMEARDLELSASDLEAVDGRGNRQACPWEAVDCLVRGIRLWESTEVEQTTERKLSLSKALITGGIAVTKKVTTTHARTTSEKEAFLLVHRRDGGPDFLLPERRLNYRCLGAAIQPSRFANFTALCSRIQAAVPGVPLDDRITRPGFLAGLPPTSLDPVDLALHLVLRARQLGC